MPDQNELDQLADAELQRLQRQYRALQLEMRNLMEAKRKELRRTNLIITKLQKEHQTLMEDITILESGIHARVKAKKEKRLTILQKENLEMLQKLQIKRVELWEIEGHIKNIEKNISILRINEVPDHSYRDIICRVRKNVVKLENRLDVVNKRCSDVLAENSKLRESINHMLKERASFNNMWQSFVTKFDEGKKYIMDLIDQSTQAYEQREELCNKLQVLIDRNENEKLIHVQEMREMQRRLEYDEKLYKFFDIKIKGRTNPELEQREIDKRLIQKNAYEKQLAEYEEIIEEIKNLYNEKNTENLAAQFKHQEEENFALFNYVNDLNHEVEILHNTTQDLIKEIEHQRDELTRKEEKQKNESLDYLNKSFKDIERLLEESIDQKVTMDKRLQNFLGGIHEIFSKIACPDAPILNILNSKDGLTEHNVKLIIGVIERHINLMINNINTDDLSTKILAQRNRIPKFNIRDSAKS